MKKMTLAIAFGAALLSGAALAQTAGDDNEPVYGSQIMTQQERTEYRNRMRQTTTQQEREQIRNEHHEQMRERARERGITLPEEPPARGGMGQGQGAGMGQGMGQGAGNDNEPVYGSQIMTQQERTEYRNRMRQATTQQEREQIRNQHHEQMRERARERGITLPEVPPARGGMGQGQGGGMGQGGASGDGKGGNR